MHRACIASLAVDQGNGIDIAVLCNAEIEAIDQPIYSSMVNFLAVEVGD
jgi:hypothetical protein